MTDRNDSIEQIRKYAKVKLSRENTKKIFKKITWGTDEVTQTYICYYSHKLAAYTYTGEKLNILFIEMRGMKQLIKAW